MLKKVAILGSTGSIGTQALQVINAFPQYFEVVALVANRNVALLAQQVKKFKPRLVAVADEEKAEQLKQQVPIPVWAGKRAVEELVTMAEIDVVLNALVGFSGLKPTLLALEHGKDIALANKEALVVGGELLKKKTTEKDVKLLPVDSEHSAIFQCLQAGKPDEVAKIYLTASGGAFLNTPLHQLKYVTPEQALKHPNWQMGPKITIDSATLMNKGLEVIEARWFFDIDYESIKVIIHPQSIVHSMVEFIDGSIIGQMGPADMFFPIQYALTFPQRWPNRRKKLNLFFQNRLTFQEPDYAKFPCLKLAYEAGREGKTMPAVLNAANEIAVQSFLKGDISFTAIPRVIEAVLARHTAQDPKSFEVLEEVDFWARKMATEIVSKGEN
jgi:1-deoxy-D-xylulose-5-phosphate reductoisomerase